MLMGMITVPAGGGGTFLGGYLVKRYDLNCAGIIRMCLMATVAATLFTTCFFLSCPNLAFAGVTRGYAGSADELASASSVLAMTSDTMVAGMASAQRRTPYSLDNDCNRKCGCNGRQYDPICGSDGVMYYSPCHAGCTKELSMDQSKVYLDCECIEAATSGSQTAAMLMAERNGTAVSSTMRHDSGYDAINTMCESHCGRNMWLFAALCFGVMAFTFLATMPALTATLRCVHNDQRSFALGIQWVKVRMLGTIPAPLIFGRLIDETCILWQEGSGCEEGGGGSCLVYDNDYMSKWVWWEWVVFWDKILNIQLFRLFRYMLALAFIGKLCSIVFFFGAWWFYIPPKKVDFSREDAPNNDVVVLNNAEVLLANGPESSDRFWKHDIQQE